MNKTFWLALSIAGLVACDIVFVAVETAVAVDTLVPRVELEIRTDEVLVVPLAFLARNGAGTRRGNGDLEIPVVYGGAPGDSASWWSAQLVDSTGRTLIMLGSLGTRLPYPLVIDSALVPPTAVAALVAASRSEEIEGASLELRTQAQSIVRVPTGPEP